MRRPELLGLADMQPDYCLLLDEPSDLLLGR
jgi:hypothetical protein